MVHDFMDTEDYKNIINNAEENIKILVRRELDASQDIAQADEYIEDELYNYQTASDQSFQRLIYDTILYALNNAYDNAGWRVLTELEIAKNYIIKLFEE